MGIGFQLLEHMSCEFPEGDVAVNLDGGSHFYERGGYRITEVRPTSLPLSSVASRMSPLSQGARPAPHGRPVGHP